MRALILALVAISGSFPSGLAAANETAFAYSEPDSTYGICANCPAPAEAGAVESCRDAGGSACAPVLTCGSGWAATAFSEVNGPLGVGLACGLSSSVEARILAYAACTVETGHFCYLVAQADPRGNLTDLTPDATFALTFDAQLMLQSLGLDVGAADGDPGPRTRAAVTEFERRIGFPETGRVDADLLWRLRMAIGGQARFLEMVKRAAVDPAQDGLSKLFYATATGVEPTPSFGNELMAMPERDRLAAIALHLMALGYPCSVPAKSAAPPFDTPDELWIVTCAEGQYDAFLFPDGNRTVSASRN